MTRRSLTRCTMPSSPLWRPTAPGRPSRWSPRARRRGRPAQSPLCPAERTPAAPAYREMTLEEFRRTAERPAAPLPLHDFTAPGPQGPPRQPLPGTASPAPHLHPPVRRGGHPYPPGRSRTCPRRKRHLRPQPPPRRTRERTTVPARLNPPLPPAHPSPPSGPSGRMPTSARLKPRPTSR